MNEHSSWPGYEEVARKAWRVFRQNHGLYSYASILALSAWERIGKFTRNEAILEESKQLLSSVDGKYSDRDFAIITLFLNCGLRVSELVGIDLNDISDDMTSVTVTGKGSKQRRIFFNDACRQAIKAYLKVRPTDVKYADRNALFISRNKNRISVKTVQWLIYKHLKEAGLGNLNMSVHKLRHTAATIMYNYGNTDVRVLKDILGHEDLSTTEIYTHIDSKKLIEAANNNPLASGVERKKNSKQNEDEE